MSSLDKVLYKTRMTLRQACKQAGIDFSEDVEHSLEGCLHCGIWLKPKELVPDLDNNPICKTCLEYEGA